MLERGGWGENFFWTQVFEILVEACVPPWSTHTVSQYLSNTNVLEIWHFHHFQVKEVWFFYYFFRTPVLIFKCEVYFFSSGNSSPLGDTYKQQSVIYIKYTQQNVNLRNVSLVKLWNKWKKNKKHSLIIIEAYQSPEENQLRIWPLLK